MTDPRLEIIKTAKYRCGHLMFVNTTPGSEAEIEKLLSSKQRNADRVCTCCFHESYKLAKKAAPAAIKALKLPPLSTSFGTIKQRKYANVLRLEAAALHPGVSASFADMCGTNALHWIKKFEQVRRSRDFRYLSFAEDGTLLAHAADVDTLLADPAAHAVVDLPRMNGGHAAASERLPLDAVLSAYPNVAVRIV